MGLFDKKSGTSPSSPISKVVESLQADIIKVDWEPSEEDDLLIHKYGKEDFPDGSRLIVPHAMSAVFINYVNSGSSIDGDGKGNAQVSVFTGPKEYRLSTGESRFAPFRKITNSLTGGQTAFHSLVYFVKNIYMTDLTWGAGFEMDDPETGLQIHVGASGRMAIHIENDPAVCAQQVRKFLEKVVGVKTDYTKTDIVNFFDEKIKLYVPDLVANVMESGNIGILHMTTKMRYLSDEIQKSLKDHFNQFGITLDSFSFNNISARDEDLAKLKKAKQDAVEMDVLSAAEARKRQREGYTYQQEHSFDVMKTAVGNKGAGSSGIAGIGMGVGMGGALGGILAGGMNAMAASSLGAAQGQQAFAGQMQQPAQQMQQPAQQMQQPAQQMQQPIASKALLCPSCGANVPEGAKFCNVCGAKVIKEELCPNCGKPVAPGSKFCNECGCKLIKVCPNCGNEVSGKFCSNCGTQI